MSLRSQHSVQSVNAPSAVSFNDSAVYQAALRVAYLVHLLATSAQSSTANDVRSADVKLSNRQSDGSWSNALYSIGDLFKSDSKSTKEVRFPKDFVKVFGGRIEAVARGSDPAYTDAVFRSTIGAFYGAYNNATFQRQLKDNRKIEELIITFVSTATGVLRKRMQGDEWKGHLMSQVAFFVGLIRDGLREVKHVPPELLSRLNIYLERLGPPIPASNETNGDAASTAPTVTPLATSAAASELVRQVALVFGVPEEQLKRDITAIKRFCTEKAALRDLKTCMGLVVAGARFPGRREDFDNDDAYSTWRKSELESIQHLILQLATANKDIVRSDHARSADGTSALSPTTSYQSSPMPSSSSFRSSLGGAPYPDFGFDDVGSARPTSMMLSADDDSAADLTFVPPDPRLYYARLLEVCLGHDLEIVKELDAHEEVSLRILSRASHELLVECALRWRLMLPYRATAFLEEMARRYSNDEIPIIQCVTEAIADIDRVVGEWDYDRWTIKDRTELHKTLSDLFDTFLRRLYEGIATPDSTTLDETLLLKEASEIVYANTVFREDVTDLDDRFEELRRAIRAVAAHRYEERRIRAARARAADEHVSELLRLCDWLKESAATLNKRFKQPLLAEVDVVALYVGETAPSLAADLHASRGAVEAMLTDDPETTAEAKAQREADVRELYEAARELVAMHDAFNAGHPLQVDFSAFEPWLRKWLTATDAKTMGWVQSAISVDKFEPEGQDRHSSSIVDLIDSCKSAVAFVQNLQWPDKRANALYLTRLAQTISKAIEEYCAKIEQLFMAEMFPRIAEEPETDEKTSAWLIKAKGLYSGFGKQTAQPFSFKAEPLVMLNNIQAARDLIDKMYSTIDADAVADILGDEAAGNARSSQATQRFLFTVKVVLGERLIAKNETSKLDPFLTLSDTTGRRIAKTRTLYDTPDPRWSETFDISVQGHMWLAATVYDRNLVDEHDLLGRAFIHLDPAKYGDFLAHDLWLKLDTHGRLLIRISMEGEKDDIQFYFGRAFRSLKRTEADMVRIIVDKMSPLIRQFLSRTVVRSLVKKGYSLDLTLKDLKIKDIDLRLQNLKLDRFRNLFSSSSAGSASASPLIPPVHEIAPLPSAMPTPRLGEEGSPAPAGKKKDAVLTDTQIEDAIGLLFEYFEETFATLKGTLSDAAFDEVMKKIWKEILTVMEGLLVPPLSDQPAEMKPLADKEVYIVIRWLKGLLNFFHAEGAGVSLEELQNSRYHALSSLPLFYDMGTDELEIECNRAVNQLLAAATGSGGPALATIRHRAGGGGGMVRSKSVYSQRNLGTIKQRKREKRQDKGKDYRGTAEMMMRILRMRPRTQDFLTQQLTTLKRIDQEAAKQAMPSLNRRGASDLRRPTTNRLTVPGSAAASRSNPSTPRSLSPVQLVDRPLPPRPT